MYSTVDQKAARFSELKAALAAIFGITLPDDSTEKTLVRDLLTSLKTFGAAKSLGKKQRRSGPNPDLENSDDGLRAAAGAMQFSADPGGNDYGAAEAAARRPGSAAAAVALNRQFMRSGPQFHHLREDKELNPIN